MGRLIRAAEQFGCRHHWWITLRTIVVCRHCGARKALTPGSVVPFKAA